MEDSADEVLDAGDEEGVMETMYGDTVVVTDKEVVVAPDGEGEEEDDEADPNDLLEPAADGAKPGLIAAEDEQHEEDDTYIVEESAQEEPEDDSGDELEDLEAFQFPAEVKIETDCTGGLAFRKAVEKFDIVVFPVDRVVERLGNVTLDLRHYSLGDKGAEALADALCFNTTVENFHVPGNFIGPVGGKSLAKSLITNTWIVDVDLSDNNLGSMRLGSNSQTFGDVFAAMLRENSTITRLNLSKNKLSDDDVVPIVEAESDRQLIREMDLSHNSMQESGGVAIGRMIATHINLEILHLKWNTLRDFGCTAITQSMADSHLHQLDLSWTGLSDGAASALGACLGRTTLLKHIDLSHNRITRSGAEALAVGIADSSCDRVVLAHNPLGLAGLLEIIDAAARATGVAEIDLRSCHPSCEEIQRAIQTTRADNEKINIMF